MLNMTIGHWVARLVQVAAKLRIADLLGKGPRTASDLTGRPLIQLLEMLETVLDGSSMEISECR
jgi:hypothetical protein